MYFFNGGHDKLDTQLDPIGLVVSTPHIIY